MPREDWHHQPRRRENVEQRRERWRWRVCPAIQWTVKQTQCHSIYQAAPLSLTPRSSLTITTNSFECRCRIGNILVANSNVRLCVYVVVLVVLRDVVAVKKGYQFHLLRVCVQKTKKKTIIKRPISVWLKSRWCDSICSYSSRNASPVARRSHQLALEAVALIAFAQSGQARPGQPMPGSWYV